MSRATTTALAAAFGSTRWMEPYRVLDRWWSTTTSSLAALALMARSPRRPIDPQSRVTMTSGSAG